MTSPQPTLTKQSREIAGSEFDNSLRRNGLPGGSGKPLTTFLRATALIYLVYPTVVRTVPSSEVWLGLVS